MEIISTIGSLCSAFIAITAVLSLVCKPIRNLVVKIFAQHAKDEKQSEAIKALQDDMAEVKESIGLIAKGQQASLRNSILELSYRCIDRGSITTSEKLNLMDMYLAYHALKGDQYATDWYNRAIHLEEKG